VSLNDNIRRTFVKTRRWQSGAEHI